MKGLTLALLLAALLLTGCGVTEPTVPTETTEPTIQTEAAPPTTLLTAADGSIRTYTLESGFCAGILRLGAHYALLTTDGTMYLLDGDELAVINTHALGCSLSSDDPSLVVKDENISYFDTQRGAYVTLGRNLTEISAMTIQDEIVAGPLMTPDCSTIYYCTEAGVRAMDVTTGNSRLLRQEHQPIVTLDSLLFDGATLRYTRRISEDETETCFIRTTDGSQVYFADLQGSLTTWGNAYAAAVELELPMERFRQILTGTVGSEPQVMAIEQGWDDALFPGGGALLLQTLTDSGLSLQLYDLTAGTILAETVFDAKSEPFPYAWKDGDDLWLWEESSGTFFRWRYCENAVQGESLLVPRHTLEIPDEAAMEQVEQLRVNLEQTYGISLHIAQDGNRTTGVDYSGYPDYRPGQYLAALNRLSDAMARFPEGFFGKLEHTAIELVDDFDPAMGMERGTGSLEIGEETTIRVSICADLEPIFYHELFHAMELEIQSKTNRLSDWESRNPDGFEYTGSYSAYFAGELENSEFLTPGENAVADAYGLVSPREDRAQTFLYAMLDGEKDRFGSETMHEKLSLLSDAIRRAFGWRETEETLPWEQYIAE